MTLGDFASVVTLLLFIFYLVGRFITIIKNRDVFPDSIKIKSTEFDRSEFDIVETFELECKPFNAFILTSEQGIYNLSVYKVIYDDDFNRIGRKK